MKSLFLTAVTLLTSAAFATKYTIDTTASKVEWSAGKKIGDVHTGEIKVKSGNLETDAKGMIKSGEFVIDMKTISNTDLKEKPDYQKKLVDHLSSDDFFKITKFPESKFKMTSIAPKANSKDEFIVKGELTMIGTTKPVEVPVKITTEKDVMTGTGVLKIERLNWGLQYGSGSIFKTLTADKIINDSFDLTLKLVAKK